MVCVYMCYATYINKYIMHIVIHVKTWKYFYAKCNLALLFLLGVNSTLKFPFFSVGYKTNMIIILWRGKSFNKQSYMLLNNDECSSLAPSSQLSLLVVVPLLHAFKAWSIYNAKRLCEALIRWVYMLWDDVYLSKTHLFLFIIWRVDGDVSFTL